MLSRFSFVIAALVALVAAWCLPSGSVPHFKVAGIEHALVTPAHAQMPIAGFPPGTFDNKSARDGTGTNPASATFQAHAAPTCASTTCTGSGISLTTTPSSTDIVAVLVCLRGSATISSMTYNSSAMTQVASAAGVQGAMTSDIWYITGSAVMTNPATVVAITSAAPTRFMISIYDVQASSSTPTGGNNGTSTGPSSAAVTVNSNGVALADGCQQTPGTGPTMTGGGVTVDDTYLNTNALLGGHTTTAGSDTITTTVGSGGGLNTALSLAAWPHD